MNGQLRPMRDDVQLGVCDQHGDLDDAVDVGVETGHLQIDPDHVVLGAHGLGTGRVAHLPLRRALSTACAWSAALARFQTLISVPSGPITKVARVMPMLVRP